jgi:carotenoid 1,2-hydratase
LFVFFSNDDVAIQSTIMQVFLGPDYDGSFTLGDHGSYEWWYVDALSPDNEWGAVVIAFRGMPMSPDYLVAMANQSAPPTEHWGYAVSVYHRGVRIAQAFRGVDGSNCRVSEVLCDVTVGPCNMYADAERVSLVVDTADDRLPNRVQLAIDLVPTIVPSSAKAPFQENHAWVVAAPSAVGTMRVCISDAGNVLVREQVNVRGYHDHNVGRCPMQNDFDDWHWGRYHTDHGVFVYLGTNGCAWAGELWEGYADVWRDVTIAPVERRLSRFGLLDPRRIRVQGVRRDGTNGTVDVVQRNVLDDGPFYRRYLASWTIDGTPSGFGMSEYMDASRYRQAWIRPFLRLPWLR